MNKFVFNEKILNDILIASKINKNEERDFLNWSQQLIRKASKNKIEKLNFKFGKIEKFESVPIEHKNDLSFIFYIPNSKFLDAFIVILKQFNFDYWDEKLGFLIDKKDIENIQYSNILVHAYNNIEFIDNNNQKLKVFLDNLIEKIEAGKIDYYSEVLQVLILLTNRKNDFGNGWLIKSIDKLIVKSQNNMSKQFAFILDKMSYMLKELDFTDIKISKQFKKIIRKDMIIYKNKNLYPFYFEVDVQKYWQEEKLVEQIVLNNISIGFNLIVDNFQRDVDMLDVYIKKPTKTSLALVSLSDNQQTIEKIEGLVDRIFKMCKESDVLIKEKFEKDILFLMLNDDLKTNSGSSSGKKTKI